MRKLFSLLFTILLLYCLISEKAVSQSTNKCLLSQGVITGPQSVPSGSSAIYTTTPVENATTLLWTVPVGWVITSGQGTLAITVTAGATFGNIFFYGYNECGVTVAFRALMVIANNSPVPVSVTITSNPVGTTCSGTPVTFTAVPVNGGPSPFFQWMVNGGNVGGNSNTYSYTPVNNDMVVCKLTSDLPNVFNNPATSNVLTMSVNPSLPVSVSIAASANPVCSGTSVTYTATPTNEGSAPIYQWKVNGVNAGTNSASYSYTPSDNDAVTCVLTSNATCATGSPATSNIVNISTSFTINHVAGAVAPVTKTVTYGTVANIPGETSKCWITSNLGADHQATSVDDATEASAGWYWQFNRKQGYKHDGTTRTPNTTWISSISENSDWQATNDPCTIELGSGWRIPTYSEWTNVNTGGGWTNWNGPWNSNLKLHAAGYLDFITGSLSLRGSYGSYWSSTQVNATGIGGWSLDFTSSVSHMVASGKAWGLNLRCLKDN